MSHHINIISRSNGVGLDQDSKLVAESLKAAGMHVTQSHCREISPWRALFPQKNTFDLNIFLERPFPRWFKSAKLNLLIPNQERFPERLLPKLKNIDRVLCKSQHASEIFSQHAATTFIGFSSPNRSTSEHTTDYQSYLHLAGKSTLKGTSTLLEIWAKHPEWPTLTLVQHASNAPSSVPANVELISEYISNERLSTLLNTKGVHLCPSLSEGWGHYIVEAMSCCALVITTDAPPMNELITAQRGILVPFHKSEPRHLGTNFYADPSKLESAISQVIKMSAPTKAHIAKHASDWYTANDARFRQEFPEIINDILNNPS